MDLQERYDELDEIVSTLDSLVNHTTDNDYKERLNILKYDFQDELNEIEPLLQEQYDREERVQEYEYWATQF